MCFLYDMKRALPEMSSECDTLHIRVAFSAGVALPHITDLLTVSFYKMECKCDPSAAFSVEDQASMVFLVQIKINF